jgi:hypothetical protein
VEPDAFDRILARLFGSRRLFQILGALVLIAAGVGECWYIGHFGYPRLLCIPGLILIGLGIAVIGFAILSEDSGYNF